MRGKARIVCGDSLDALAGMPEDHFHAVVTSPPYWGLRNYGAQPRSWGGDPDHAHLWGQEESPHPPGQVEQSKWPDAEAAGSGRRCACGAWLGSLGLEPTHELYVDHLVTILREIRRVLRPDGTLWLNLGDCYCASPRGKAQGDYSTSALSTPAYHENVESRRKRDFGNLKPKDLVGIPWRVAFALQADGWWLRSDIVWHKTACMPESVQDRPVRAHEFVFLLTRSRCYFYDYVAVREPAEHAGRTVRYDGSQKNDDHENRTYPGADGRDRSVGTGRNLRDVWTIRPQPFPGPHFAVFPMDLVVPCVRAGTSATGCCASCGAPRERVTKRTRLLDGVPAEDPGSWCDLDDPFRIPADGVGHGRWTSETETLGWRPTCDCGADSVPCRVLDPFAGAGTVGLVATEMGHDFYGIELVPDYARMALARIRSGGQVHSAPPPTEDLPLFRKPDGGEAAAP